MPLRAVVTSAGEVGRTPRRGATRSQSWQVHARSLNEVAAPRPAATSLQSLLGLWPFLHEVIPFISGPESDQCRTLRAVAKLMVLRQKALSKSVSNHLNNMRDVFADIDPAFRGTDMQDASEFLLRLLDTLKDEIDARRPATNPVRDNFQYQTAESYTCTKCHESMLKRWDLGEHQLVRGRAVPPWQRDAHAAGRPSAQHAARPAQAVMSTLPRRRVLRHYQNQSAAQDADPAAEPLRLPGRRDQEDPIQCWHPEATLSLNE